MEVYENKEEQRLVEEERAKEKEKTAKEDGRRRELTNYTTASDLERL